MIKSMTGYAALTCEDENVVINVTVRAVNHRHLDLQLRLPQALNNQESRVRAVLQQVVSRGRVEIAVGLTPRRPVVPQVELNEGFVAALEGALERARLRGVIAGHLTPGDLLRLPQALSIRDHPAEAGDGAEAALAELLLKAVEDVVADLERMRLHEGNHLRADLDARRGGLAALIEQIWDAAQGGQRDLQARVAVRVAELTADLPVDRTAIAQEIVRMVGRSDISEEVTRFRAHLQHWSALSDAPEPCGRKLDFLLQEMNREINTIGSKADGQGVSQLVVTAKAELEKMREQVQNVE
jgi:uncharacterized protein (TIGR00255 family)